MAFEIYDASVPIFVNSLKNMRAWLERAGAEKSEADMMEAKLAPDMRPLPAQYQMACDAAKNVLARLSGTDAPAVPDTETSFAELRERCDRTVAYIGGFDRASLAAAADREVTLKFPNGMGYRFVGADFLTRFALPNFFFHVTTAYSILRNAGVALGKPDFLQHMGQPNIQA